MDTVNPVPIPIVSPNLIATALDAMSGVHSLVDPSAELMPVMDVRHNVREIAKQLILLEDHLTQPRKRCNDCIRKHFAFAEALAEEGCGLDPDGEYCGMLSRLQEFMRQRYTELMLGLRTHNEIAGILRSVRKPLLRLSCEWMVAEKYRPASQDKDVDAIAQGPS
jgi:hypothetical protein